MDVYGAGLWDLMMIHREDVQMVVVHDNALVPRQCLSSLVMAVAGRVDCDDVRGRLQLFYYLEQI